MSLKFLGGSGIRVDERVEWWVVQRAADENIPMAALIRRALEREMAANPLVSDPGVQAEVIEYLEERCGIKVAALVNEHQRRTGGWR